MKKILLLTLGYLSILSMVSVASAESTAQKAANREFAKYNQTGDFEKCIKRNTVRKMVVIDDTKIRLL